MAKINEIISNAGRTMAKMKASPAKTHENGKKHDDPEFIQDEGNFHIGNQAVNSFTQTIPGTYTSGGTNLSDDPIKPTTLSDEEYMKSIYKKYGDDVTTQQLIDDKVISGGSADAYNKITGGKNLGVKGEDKINKKYVGLLDNFSNTTGGGDDNSSDSNTTTTTTTVAGSPGTQDYNMGAYESMNANMAQGAQRRGARRAARRGARDVWKGMTKNERKAAKAERKQLRKSGDLKKGRLNRRMQMINNTVDRDGDGVMDYNLTNPNIDAARIRGGEDVDLSSKSRQYQDLVGSLSMNKYGGGLNKFGKIHSSTPDVTTTETVVTGGSGGEGSDDSNLLDNAGTTTNTTILGKPGEGSTEITDTTGAVLENIYETDEDANIASQKAREAAGNVPTNKNPKNKNKPAYKAKSSGILKTSHHRGAGY